MIGSHFFRDVPYRLRAPVAAPGLELRVWTAGEPGRPHLHFIDAVNVSVWWWLLRVRIGLACFFVALGRSPNHPTAAIKPAPSPSRRGQFTYRQRPGAD
jgi:hypothetical protein